MRKTVLIFVAFSAGLVNSTALVAETLLADAYEDAVWKEITLQCGDEAAAFVAISEFHIKDVIRSTFSDASWSARFSGENAWPMKRTELQAEAYLFSFVVSAGAIYRYGALFSSDSDITVEEFRKVYPNLRLQAEAALPLVRCAAANGTTELRSPEHPEISEFLAVLKDFECRKMLEYFHQFLDMRIVPSTSEGRAALVLQMNEAHWATLHDYDTCMEAA